MHSWREDVCSQLCCQQLIHIDLILDSLPLSDLVLLSELVDADICNQRVFLQLTHLNTHRLGLDIDLIRIWVELTGSH